MSQELNLTKKQIDSMSQKDWDNLPIVTGPKPGDKPGTAYLNPEDESPDSPNLRDDLPKMEAEMSLPNKAIKITKGVLSLLRPNTAMLPQKEDAATAADSTFIRKHHPVFTTTFHAGASEEIKNLQDAGINLWPGWREDIIQTHKIKGEKAVELAKKKNIDVPAWKHELDKGTKETKD